MKTSQTTFFQQWLNGSSDRRNASRSFIYGPCTKTKPEFKSQNASAIDCALGLSKTTQKRHLFRHSPPTFNTCIRLAQQSAIFQVQNEKGLVFTSLDKRSSAESRTDLEKRFTS